MVGWYHSMDSMDMSLSNLQEFLALGSHIHMLTASKYLHLGSHVKILLVDTTHTPHLGSHVHSLQCDYILPDSQVHIHQGDTLPEPPWCDPFPDLGCWVTCPLSPG